MSKVIKTANSMMAAIAVLSGTAMAAAPTAFDAWTVTNGDISTSVACPAGFSCGDPVTGKGFFQRQITDGSGSDYFQTIITDVDATGDPTTPSATMGFSDESFVKQGNNSGLADKSSAFDSTTSGTVTEVFQGTTELLTGWANNGGGASTANEANIYQSISAVDTAAEDFDTKFWLSQVGDQGATGKHMRIAGTVEIDAASASKQTFVLVDLSGTNFVSAPGGVDIDVPPNGDDLTWAAGDRIKAIWVGQDMVGLADVAQEFGYTAYEAAFVGDTGTVVSTFSLTTGAASAPVDWDTGLWGSTDPDGVGPF